MIRLAERYPGKTGMTLIELVVVLALLAGLAAMALTGVADLGNRARYDETVTRMDLIRQAVVGDGSEAGRFIRDMGRLPDSLGELIAGTNNYSSMAFTFNVPSYPPIPATLCAGWAGPYLQGSGTNIYDGFGEALQLNGGTQLVAVVKDRTGWLTNHMVYSFAHATQCTLQVQVRALRANPQESVCIWHAACSNDSPFIDWIPGIEYFPNTLCQYEKQVYVCLVNNTNIAPPTSLGTNWFLLRQHEYFTRGEVILAVPDTAGATPAFISFTNSFVAANPVLFTNLCPGPRPILAYGYNEGPSMTTNGWHSGVQSIEIRPGANFVTLYLTERL